MIRAQRLLYTNIGSSALEVSAANGGDDALLRTSDMEGITMSKKFTQVSGDGFVGAEGPIKKAGWDKVPGDREGSNASAQGLAAGLIFGGIEGVKQALAPLDRGALDKSWDRGQQRLTAATLLKQTDPDQAVVKAADLIAATLLWEGGALGQTKLSYEDEVDFGLRQIELSKRADIAAALQAAGLETIFGEASAATKELEAGLNRAPDQRKALAPAAALRAATRECARRFTLAYSMIEELAAITDSGPDADHLRALLTPLDQLAQRA